MINKFCRLAYRGVKPIPVIPTVYTDALSYGEQVGIIGKKCDETVDKVNEVIDDLEAVEEQVQVLDEWVDNFDTSYAKEVIQDNIGSMIFVEINSDGYIVYNIPEEWTDITFNTVGKDIAINNVDYGTLVLSY